MSERPAAVANAPDRDRSRRRVAGDHLLGLRVAMLRLRTLGGLSIESDRDSPSHVPEQRRQMALLALLALARDRCVSRDRLLGYLWPESDEARARHALAQALHALRRDLRCDALVLGTAELRLNPEAITSDAADFEDALDRHEPERAASLYRGPFLDGFHISNAPDFDRWADGERMRLGRQYRGALEALAAAAERRGDVSAAAGWWRRLAELDPLDGGSALGLMRALARAGDRVGALRYAHVHESLLREELDIAPEPAVAALVERLRTESAALRDDHDARASAADAASRGLVSPVSPPASAGDLPNAEEQPSAMVTRRAPFRSPLARWLILPAAAAIVGAAVVATALARRSSARAATVIAVGTIRQYGGTDTSNLTRALGDLLATNLARVPRLQVVSNTRMHELLGQLREHTAPEAAVARAARRAGATEMVEGTLYRLPDGSMRLNMQRVDLATGSVQSAYSVAGADPYVLADRSTAELAARFGVRVESLRVVDVTTGHPIAYRLYEEGLRAFYQYHDIAAAQRLFTAALVEDSTFAMAAYYAYLAESILDPQSSSEKNPHLAQAMRMADRATDRERLMLRAAWLQVWHDPSHLAVAETLVTRYPTEPDGRYWLGVGLMWSGDFLGSLAQLRRVVAMDSLSLRGATALCRACDAIHSIIDAYLNIDSVAAAERTAREYTRIRPRSADSWALLYNVLVAGGRYEEAQSVRRTLDRIEPTTPDARAFAQALIALRKGDFADADGLLAELERDTNSVWHADGAWYSAISLRYQGRVREALEVGRHNPVVAAQVLHEQGRWREAAALFDSVAQHPPFEPWQRGRVARHRAWYLTHSATARAAAGDTSTLAAIADSVEVIATQSAYGRDRRLHHHVRGLLLAARGRWSEAESMFRRALYSPTFGYTRTNLELGRVLLARRRPGEAIAILRPALRGSLEASNLYVTHTELHELLARAYDEAGQPDSAAAHYRWVVNAWRGADPQFRPRREVARRRLVALGR
jgi:DNA-binding SARP family transcriptional activator/TolB-like protein